jgi:hypothetical protein
MTTETPDQPAPEPDHLAKFRQALEGFAYSTDTALDKAIWAWADHADLPHLPEIRNRVACAMFAALAIFLEAEQPAEMGWLGLKNRQFAEAIKERMKLQAADDAGGGVMLMAVGRRRDAPLVELKVTEDLAFALLPDIARTMAAGLLDSAGDIDGLRGTIFMLGAPPVQPGDRRPDGG